MKGLDLLVEVGTEEIPAGYIAPALAALEERLAAALAAAGLSFSGGIKTWATPRRLALAVRGLAGRQADKVQEVTGPPVRAAFDAAGAPTKAALGFARSQGVEVSELITVETPKGPYLAARKELEGRPAARVLPEILPSLLLGLPFPKSMRWGQGEVTFVRPIHWLLALLDGEVLAMDLGGIRATNCTYGHRFLHPGPIEVGSLEEYEEKLRLAHVVVSTSTREELVRTEIARVTAEAGRGLRVVPDEELVTEVANLVEEPVACLGRFDDVFLGLPRDVVITAMREHQRYFAVTDEAGNLRPHFVAVNNTKARDLAVVTRGHERVLRARLEDARFYFEDDRRTSLESKQEQLKQVVFHNRLGTSWQKVERFTGLAGYLADLLDPEIKPTLLRAAGLCKCDLVTGVVGQFPSLQGVMGREYARLDGEPEPVAEAIFEHYLPLRAGGELPRTSAGALLSLADKVDTIAGCFGVGLLPTGATDPFALRRQALGVINIILDRGLRLSLNTLMDQALEGLAPWLKRPASEVRTDVIEFFRLRLKNQLTAQGASTDGAEAVLSVHHDDLVAAAAKTWALEEIKRREDFNDLAVAFKRVVNIIRKFGAEDTFDPGRLTQDQEKALLAAALEVEARTGDLVRADDYRTLLRLIVGLKPTVDAFFDHVLVDDPDPALKANRLALLARVSRLFALVADFSRIST
ncbi:MAG: glycine--tRNA ligase subunit beta [Thermodesulfobacteriota bacterium]